MFRRKRFLFSIKIDNYTQVSDCRENCLGYLTKFSRWRRLVSVNTATWRIFAPLITVSQQDNPIRESTWESLSLSLVTCWHNSQGGKSQRWRPSRSVGLSFNKTPRPFTRQCPRDFCTWMWMSNNCWQKNRVFSSVFPSVKRPNAITYFCILNFSCKKFRREEEGDIQKRQIKSALFEFLTKYEK